MEFVIVLYILYIITGKFLIKLFILNHVFLVKTNVKIKKMERRRKIDNVILFKIFIKIGCIIFSYIIKAVISIYNSMVSCGIRD